jgi:CRP/FNR family transcriptional regulator
MSVSCDQSGSRGARNHEPTVATPFGQLPQSVMGEMEAVSFPVQYPAGVALFNEGEPARGIFMLHSGRVKLYLCSGDGRTLILRMAKAGDVLGLPGTLTGRQYEVTAETLSPCQLTFVKREPFLRLMREHIEISIGVAEQLTTIYGSACHGIRCLGLSHSSGEKLAGLLLQWPLNDGDTPSRIKFPFRHEEVAQMIGSSRETVSRLFVEFKKRNLAELDGSTLYVRDRERLHLIATGKTLISPKITKRSDTPARTLLASEPRSGKDHSHSFYTEGV